MEEELPVKQQVLEKKDWKCPVYFHRTAIGALVLASTKCEILALVMLLCMCRTGALGE